MGARSFSVPLLTMGMSSREMKEELGRDDEGLRPAGAQGGHLGQAAAVAGGILGAAQGGHRVVGGEGGAVAEGDAAAERDRPGVGGGVVAPRLRQRGLGLHLQVKLHKTLVEQAADVLLRAVAAGDGIQRQTLQIRQGERGDGNVLFLLLLLVIIRQLVIDLVGIGVGVAAAAAQQRQQRAQRQKQTKQAFFLHTVLSSKASMAACAPRALPIFRCDQ